MSRRIAALIVGVGTILNAPSASAWVNQAPCRGNYPIIASDFWLRPSLYDPTDVDTRYSYHRAVLDWSWQEWDYMTPYHVMRIDWNNADYFSPFNGGGDGAGYQNGINHLAVGTTRKSLGSCTAYSSCGWGINAIQELDLQLISTTTVSVPSIANCSLWTNYLDNVMVHELGHAWGFGHFDDWLSTMNTFQPKLISSCRSDGRQRPSSDAQQGHAAYNGAFAAVDVGGAAIVQNFAPLTAGGGSSIPSWGIQATPPSSWHWYWIDFTYMNMRNAWPQSSVSARVVLSDDLVVDASDTVVWTGAITSVFPGAIYQYSVQIAVPPNAVPAGTSRKILVQFDYTNSAQEWDETDNVIKTNYWLWN